MKKIHAFHCLTVMFVLLCGISIFHASSAYAAVEPSQMVHVVVENTTKTDVETTGTFVDEYISPTADMTMLSAVKQVLDSKSISSQSSAGGFTNIKGLGESGGMWFAMLNDWFIDQGMSDFSVEAGDEVKLVYSTDGGQDVGSFSGVSEYVHLKSIGFSAGELVPEFSSAVTEYTLSLGDVSEITVNPVSENKNYQVRIYKGEDPDTSKGGYKRTQKIPAVKGDVITVACGDPTWPSTTDATYAASVYKFTVDSNVLPNTAPKLRDAVQKEKDERVDEGSPFTLDLVSIFVDPEGDELKYQVSVDDAERQDIENSQYSINPENAGIYKLEFWASDGKLISEPYTVNLAVDDGTKYNITYNNPENGTIEIRNNTEGNLSREGRINDIIEVTLKPENFNQFVNFDDYDWESYEAYVLKSLTIKDANGNDIPRWQNQDEDNFEKYNNTFYFKMPLSDVEVNVEYDVGWDLWIYLGGTTDKTIIFEDEEGNFIKVAYKDTYQDTVFLCQGPYQYKVYDTLGKTVSYGKINIDSEGGDLNFSFISFTITTGDLPDEGTFSGGAYVTLRDPDGNEITPARVDKETKGKSPGNSHYSFFVQSNMIYTYEIIAADENASCESSEPYDGRITVSSNDSNVSVSYSISFTKKDIVCVVDHGADAHLYKFPNKAYVKMPEVTADSIVQNSPEGMDTYTYSVDPTGVRVQYILVAGGGTTGYEYTYKDAIRPSNSSVVLHLNPKSDDSTPYDDPALYTDDLYTNVRDEGSFMTMNVGETFNLQTFRTNQTVTTSTTNRFIEPEKTYEVISGDSIELAGSKEQGDEGRKYMGLKAVKEGVSIIKITYGALNVSGYKSRFNPIAKVHTGIVIVNVVSDANAKGAYKTITPGVTIPNDGRYGDSGAITKYDTIYFAGNITGPDNKIIENAKGYTDYPFSPSVSGDDKIEAVEYHEPIHLQAVYSDTWSPAEKEGDHYLVRLKSGRNIIRITTKKTVRYFVINAMETDVTISNKSREGQSIMKGEDVNVSFTNLELPVKKMCAIYNPGYPSNTYLSYKRIDGGNVTEIIGPRDQYAVRSSITFKADKSGELVLDGGEIHCTHMGSDLDSHCSIGEDGLEPNFDASNASNDAYFCVLPRITIPVESHITDFKAAVDKIDQKHPLLSIRAIMDARDFYEKLDDDEKAEAAEACEIYEAAYKKVEAIIKLIDWIEKLSGTPSMADAAEIDEMEKTYNELPAEQQLVVGQLTKLKDYIDYVKKVRDLITEINKLPSLNDVKPENRDAIQKLLDTYNSLTDDQKAYVLNYDTLKKLGDRVKDLTSVEEVTDLIKQIEELTETNYESKEALILKARQLYELLSADQKKLVTNIDELTAAEQLLNTFKSDPDIRKLIELIKELRDGTDGKGNGPLNQTGNSWEVWKSWADYVKNVRAMVDRIGQDRQGMITNLADLEAAEKQVQSIRIDWVLGLIRALPSETTVDYYDPSAVRVAAASEAAEVTEAAEPVENYDIETAAAGRQMTEAELNAIATAKDEYDSLSTEERATLARESASSVTKLEALDDKAASYDGYVETVMQKFLNRVETCLGADGQVTRLDIAAAAELVTRYESFPAERREVLDKLVTAQGTTGAKLLEQLAGQKTTAEAEIAETERIDELISSLPTVVNADNLDAVKAEVEAIEAAIAKLSDDAKGYLYQMNRLEALKKLLDELGVEILDPDTPMDDIPLEEAKPEVTAKSAGYNSVTVTWTEVSGAQSYRIYRQKKGKGSYTKVATVDATVTSWTNKNLVTNRVYRYKVRAVAATEAGNIYSQYGVSAKVQPVPAKASITKVAAGKRYLKVTWKKVSGASGYVVYRASSKNGKYKAVKTVKSGKTVSWKNTKLTGGKTYYYKVRAYRTVSGKKVYGSYSAKVSGKAKK